MFGNKILFNYFLHILNGIIPFLMIIILTHLYSVEFLGKYYFAFSIISITQLIVDYSFSFSALRKYKFFIDKDSKISKKINLFINVFICKLLISFLLIFLFTFFVNKLKIFNDSNVIVYILLGIFLSLTNFNWFFYATQNSFKNSILLLIFRILFLIPLYFKFSLTHLLVITFLPVILSSLLILLYLLKSNYTKLNNFVFEFQILDKFKEGASIFLNSIIISVFVNSWPIMFKMYLSNEQIGMFGIADKIVKGMMSLITPIPNFILSQNKIFDINILFKNPKIIWILISLIFVPVIFILTPNNILSIFIGNNIKYRTFFNIYTISFLSGTINIILYTFLIYYNREIFYLLCFFISALLLLLYNVLFSFSIYNPLIFDFLLAFSMLFFFQKNKKIRSVEF